MRKIFSVAFASTWILVSEFLRNEVVFKYLWISHFQSIGLDFITKPINGFMWLIWSFCMAYIIYELIQKFTFIKTLYISWFLGFFMMWIVIYNLQVLPLQLLIYAIPLSLFEIYIAALIIKKMHT